MDDDRKSLRDMLADEIHGPDPDPAGEQTEETPDAPAADAPGDADAAAEGDDRPRDAHGRFVARGEDGPKDTPASAGADDQRTGDGGEAPTAPIAAPASWSAEDSAVFNKLPRDAQAVLARRESERDADYQRKSQEIAEIGRRYEALDRVLEPRRQALRQQGVDEARLIDMYFAIDEGMSRDPVNTLRAIAKRFDVDLTSLNPASGSPDEDLEDPALAGLNKSLSSLQDQLAEMKAERDREITEAQAQQRAQLQAEVNAFRDAVDETGALKHPHYDTVRAQMGVVFRSGAAKTLEEAYAQAVWAHPELRQRMLEDEVHARTRADAERRKQEAEKASRAAVSVTGAPGATAAPSSGGGSIRDILKSEFDRASGGL